MQASSAPGAMGGRIGAVAAGTTVGAPLCAQRESLASGDPPLVWNAPASLDPKLRRRPSVGYAQQLLNRFLSNAQVKSLPEARLRSQLKRGELAVDCVFGTETELVTRAFQTSARVNPDGKIGPITWSFLESFGIRRSPVTPNATPQAQNLLFYLYEIYGSRVLSGQQEESWLGPPASPWDNLLWIQQQTGKLPAILGTDFAYADKGATDRAIEWWNRGGIPLVRYHMPPPTRAPSGDPWADAMVVVRGSNPPKREPAWSTPERAQDSLRRALQQGTNENARLMLTLDGIADEIEKMAHANVPLIWAPFHEAKPGGWFWWSLGTGGQYVLLWQLMFEHFTGKRRLNNIIWLMPFSVLPDPTFYPGERYLDLAGPDIYPDNLPPDTFHMSLPFRELAREVFDRTLGIVGEHIPMPLHETGVPPQPGDLFGENGAPWVLFNVWAGFERKDPAGIKSIYAHPRTITLDGVPDLK
jgi:peptidoglycan hydrolase-like protein with peptidoglycan-binding domain